MDNRNTMNPKRSSGSKAKKSKKSKNKRARALDSQAEKSQAVKKPWGVNKATQTIAAPVLSWFTLFPELPLEIRREIWRSTFESRKVSFQGGSVGLAPPNQPLPPNYPFELPSKDFFIYGAPYPAAIDHLPVAFVNRESRAETLLHYVRLQQDLHVPEKDGTNLRYPATIYFNPTLDIPWIFANKPQHAYNRMHLACQRLFPSYDPRAVEILKSVRTVHIWFMGFHKSDRWSFDMDACRDTLRMFENLEMIKVQDAIIHFNLELLKGYDFSDFSLGNTINLNPPLGGSFCVQSFVDEYFEDRENYPGVIGNPIRLSYLPGTLMGSF